MNRDDPALTREVVRGISEGCIEAECALLGGETAILPDFYQRGEYDLAGFCVGVVERKGVLDGTAIREGDKVIGLASSGLHSNGYSLVRRIVAAAGLAWSDPAPFAMDRTLGQALMTPTRIYVRSLLALHRAGLLKAAAHITGGGLPGNIPRVLPAGTIAALTPSWPVPPVFRWLAAAGRVPAGEMARVFNCGLGMVLVVADPDATTSLLTAEGETVFRVGTIQADAGQAGENAARIVFAPPADWLA